MAAVKAPLVSQTELPETIPVLPAADANVNTKSEAMPQNRPAFQIEEHPIDDVRSIKVGVIGAGLSGITAGVLLPAKLPGLDLRIYDKNADVGGTWYENTYPGVRCDIPAHVYQSGFEPNTQWTEEFAQGHEIREYWRGIARKYDVYRYIRFRQRVERAEWVGEKGKWRLTVRDLTEDSTYDEELDVLLNAIGHFNAWKLPDYPGLKDFQGPLFHSSNWDHSVDLKGKRVALIGNGASGLQVLPSIQPIAAHVDHYARNRTWIADSFGSVGVRRLEPNIIPQEKIDSFTDPDTYLAYRKSIEAGYFSRFGAIFKNSAINADLRTQWMQLMLRRITKPSLADKIIPDFPPNCRRPTPGPGYLEALSQDNVSYIQTPIAHFTPTAIVTTDGIPRPVDIVICATGANVDHCPPFSIIANGLDLKTAWSPTGTFGFPYNYLGVATPGFPNLLWIGGPNATGHSGSVPNSIENQVTYIAKIIRKLRSQGIKSMVPRKDATDDFLEYADHFFPRTVWSDHCSSWYNGGRPGARIHGLFPASAAALNYLRRDPRWEDWEYTYTNASGNRFAFLGNGWTRREGEEGADLTPHLRRPDEIDLRTYLETWADV
ncbi:flavin-containing monooxygenase [Aspergillus lucknowensis]|uniref:FAD/NAD(P)-binding domain-containing protein n=1 Tax=Aspergillus lucknowensis TaxID=176173 RepID=A0ABR4LS47_9EURO